MEDEGPWFAQLSPPARMGKCRESRMENNLIPYFLLPAIIMQNPPAETLHPSPKPYTLNPTP